MHMLNNGLGERFAALTSDWKTEKFKIEQKYKNVRSVRIADMKKDLDNQAEEFRSDILHFFVDKVMELYPYV
jgi:hypothetical protein